MDDKELYGVTQQTSAVDDGLQKSSHVKETNVASVALGTFETSFRRIPAVIGPFHKSFFQWLRPALMNYSCRR